MDFHTKLTKAMKQNKSLLCVGFDPVLEKLPDFLQQDKFPFFEFNKAISTATHDLVCCFKFNSAFYEATGESGMKELRLSCEYIREHFPEIPIILDAKRGDIGTSNVGYAQYAFDYVKADAVTVMPYMGIESLQVFFERKEKGIIIGCHSSNPGAKEFQELEINGKPLYHIVAEAIMKDHADNPNVMIFMGATYPEKLKTIRTIIKEKTILSPGVGAQEGMLRKVIQAGRNVENVGLIINASRSVIFASNDNDFAMSARAEAKRLHDKINMYRQ